MLKDYQSTKELQQGFVPIYLLIAFVIITGLSGASTIKTTKTFPPDLSLKSVLGENEESSEAIKKAEEIAKEDHQKNEEISKESEKKLREKTKREPDAQKTSSKPSTTPSNTSKRSEQIKNNINQRNSIKTETEFEATNGQKIKTKVEDDGTTKFEIEDQNFKFKYVIENGQVKIKAENELGEEIETSSEDAPEINKLEDELENELEKSGIEIASGSGKPIFAKNKIAAFSDFPLSINPDTNQLIVTTPNGQKTVTILPDQAVQNLLNSKLITTIKNQEDPQNIETQFGNLEGTVSLETKDDQMVYKIKGEKSRQLFGFIPVNTETTVFVSTETGNPVSQDQSVLASIIDLFSPD